VAGSNPLCGDSLRIYIALRDDRVERIAFEGSGCAISVASASMMSDMLRGRPRGEVINTINRVRDMLSRHDDTLDPALADTPVAALGAVRQYPSRIKCATLAWQAAHGGLTTGQHTVSTEQTDDHVLQRQ
jgi:nitrogen fixation NifU-like protein